MTARHVVVSAVPHELVTAVASLMSGGDIIRDVRFDGLVQLIGPDGSEVRAERCQHFRAGFGGGQVHPHRDEAAAVECARLVAGQRYPDIEVTADKTGQEGRK